MKNIWGKLTLFGAAAGAAFMALGPEEAQPPAKGGRVRGHQIAQHASYSAESAPAQGDRREFVRMLRQLQHTQDERRIGNLFNAISWYVPPPPAPSLPPPPPSAPPLPFAFIGHYRDAGSGAVVVFLTHADRVYTVSEGDVIDNTYSVGALTPGRLEFTYLPLNIKQSLNTGEAL